MEALLSEDVKIIASALKAAIDKDRKSTSKREAETGIRYYNHENDIMNNRIFYVDDEGYCEKTNTPRTYESRTAFSQKLLTKNSIPFI